MSSPGGFMSPAQAQKLQPFHERDVKTFRCSRGKEHIMPLTKGKSREAVSKNIKTLVHEYEKEGKIGKTHPPSKRKAVKQAVAISLKKAGKSKYQSRGKH